MVQTWDQVEEYSYGYLIPVVVTFLIWQKADRTRLLKYDPTWWSIALLVAAIALLLAGRLSAIRLLIQYGFIVSLFAVALAYVGWQGTKLISLPLAFTLFMIPLPPFVLRELSEILQLWSSRLGVAFIQACDISVYLEGNVIDLGSMKLQVIDACSGLRYLFPLLALGSFAAYFFRAAAWKRLVLVASTVPLTVLINSFRIGIIGLTVEYWGRSMAEGVLHDFEGWLMFMVCIALLIAEMAILSRIGPRPESLREVFALELPARRNPDVSVQTRPISRPLVGLALIILIAAATLQALPARQLLVPSRESFTTFPLSLDGWHGRPSRLDPDIVSALSVDDYFLADYTQTGRELVNFYVAYYASQSGGESTHSPRTCMPGGGWAITEIAPAVVASGQGSLSVNRVIIQKGEQRQLVYYWFKQRDRLLTNEFAVKWYIFRDGISRDRSDGALLRLITPIGTNEAVERADERLQQFLAAFEPRVAEFVPD
jgi:exosortase D (VPLPA-CTERM-specific)